MKKIFIILIVIGFFGQTIAQNLSIKNRPHYKTNFSDVLQYINKNNLAICSNNYKFVGLYIDTNDNVVCSAFLGDFDIINEKKIIASKIYYVAGLVECSSEEYNKGTSTTTKFLINLGKNNTVRYYNFSGATSYKDRHLIHYQTTDILNPKHMNAMYKTIEVEFDNVYFPETYGLEYNYKLDYTKLAQKSIETLFKEFHKIEAEYKRL